jgi:glycerol-3-phosphate dehydrogenase
LINMVTTAAEQGAAMLNYVKVTGLTKNSEGFVRGVIAHDTESGQTFEIAAKVVVNATGPWTDSVRRMAEPDAKKMISPSQGIHLVFDKSFLQSDSAIMVPHTSDGRVMFAIPWHNHTVVGTTDTPIESSPLEPSPKAEEVEFILKTAAEYLQKPPTRADVLSVYTGIRPLVKSGDSSNAASLSRDHTIHVDHSGLLTITGGKWTTYRHMAEDCVNNAATLGELPERACVTKNLSIHGSRPPSEELGHLSFYGSDVSEIQKIMRGEIALADRLVPELPYTAAEVIWATRSEMARKVEDVLARRTRALFLNSKAAIAAAPKVAELMARELGFDQEWQTAQLASFNTVARHFTLEGVVNQ